MASIAMTLFPAEVFSARAAEILTKARSAKYLHFIFSFHLGRHRSNHHEIAVFDSPRIHRLINDSDTGNGVDLSRMSIGNRFEDVTNSGGFGDRVNYEGLIGL